MTKSELVKQFAKHNALTRRKALYIIDDVIDIIASELVINRKDVGLGSLGKLACKIRKSRTAKNPQTGESVSVPETTVVIFKSSAELKRLLNPKRYRSYK